MSHLGDNHLLCVAGEHCRGKLDAKEKAAFSFKYLLVSSFRVKSVKDALYRSGQPASFSCSLQILDEKCVEFCSELNGTLLRFLWWILKELEQTYGPKVWKCCLVHFEYERVKVWSKTSICAQHLFPFLASLSLFMDHWSLSWHWFTLFT